MGRLPVAMPKTISATDRLLRSDCPPDAHRYAGDLLLTLATVEYHAGLGDPSAMLPALLRDTIIISTRLAGRTWLEANADNTAAFTALQATVHPPPLPELDHILACLLSERFGLPRPRQEPRQRLTVLPPAEKRRSEPELPAQRSRFSRAARINWPHDGRVRGGFGEQVGWTGAFHSSRGWRRSGGSHRTVGAMPRAAGPYRRA